MDCKEIANRNSSQTSLKDGGTEEFETARTFHKALRLHLVDVVKQSSCCLNVSSFDRRNHSAKHSGDKCDDNPEAKHEARNLPAQLCISSLRVVCRQNAQLRAALQKETAVSICTK